MTLRYTIVVILFLASFMFFETLQLKLWVIGFFCAVNGIFPPGFLKTRGHVRSVVTVVAVLCFAGGFMTFPRRYHDKGEPLRSIFLNDKHEHVPQPLFPFSIDNFFPEIEKAKLLVACAPLCAISRGSVILEELRHQRLWNNDIIPEYRESYREYDGRRASVQFFQCLQQLGMYSSLSHYSLHSPEDTKRMVPLIVFLHGTLGQLSFYNSYFSNIEGCAVMTPSTHDLRGLWSENDIDRIIDVYLPDVEKNFPIDRDNIHLIGLSNGGSGVNTAISRMPGAFRSFIFISSVLREPPRTFDRSKTIGMIYGTSDRVAEYNRTMERQLKEAGYRIEVQTFQDEGHLVLLSRKDEILAKIKSIIEGNG
jgi:hypothetical protein